MLPGATQGKSPAMQVIQTLRFFRARQKILGRAKDQAVHIGFLTKTEAPSHLIAGH